MPHRQNKLQPDSEAHVVLHSMTYCLRCSSGIVSYGPEEVLVSSRVRHLASASGWHIKRKNNVSEKSKSTIL